MSYDLMAFEISKAPKEKEDFLKWYDKQSEWEENHDYDDINVSSEKLQNFYKEMIKTFPPMNGADCPSDEEIENNPELEDYLTDYCIGYDVIYIAFSWSKDEEAYNLMKKLCKKYQVGFFDVSEDGDVFYWNEDEKNIDKKENNNWQAMYEENKEKFRCKVDLESYFTQNKIGEMAVDTIEIGDVSLPTGEILACDPLVELGEAKAYIQKTPVGKYPVRIAVVPSEDYGDRYACVKVEFSKNTPVVYELAVTGEEEKMDEAAEDEYYGFGVDAGMGCVADKKSQDEYIKYWNKLEEDGEADNPYDDIFEELLAESAQKFPKYQRTGGDWANWTIPGTELNIPIFASGWGDGYYPCYFGYDEKGELCGFYILFIDIEKEYSDEEEE